MNNCPGQGPPWPRRARAAVAVTVIATAALLAACSSSPSSPASGSSSAGAAAGSPSAVAFAHCVRSHGVPDYPDPGSNRGPNGSSMQQFAQELGVSLSRLQAALNACVNLNPKVHAASQPLTAQEEQDYLRAAACMRSHGFAIPDPSFSGGHASFSLPSSINTTSPQFAQALQTCQKLIPAGLPYSGSD